jgi:hypothetical protein
MSLLIQTVVLAKAQRRKGSEGKILAMVGLNSQRSLVCPTSSNVRPTAQQIVIDAGELDDGRMIGYFSADALDRHVQIEEKSALSVVTHHTLDPEE